MEAEDTVIQYTNLGYYPDVKELVSKVCKEQAEITWPIAFKAGKQEGIREGIRMYAWWKDGIQYVGTCGGTLEEALREYE